MDLQHINATLADLFVAEEVIGEGSIATVYRAREVKLERTVALKVLRTEIMADPTSVERFAREGRATAQLVHPNIITVYGFGTVSDVSYIALQLVDGPSLADVLGRGPLDVSDAVEVARALAAALDYAHGHRVIHRDVKPSNVLVPQRAGQLAYGEAVLSDFGLGEALSRDTGLTRAGMVFGTPTYMAPEQLRGEPHSAATDVYGFGVTLFEMLYGHPPFGGATALALMQAHLNEQVSFPASPPTPDGVQKLVVACLRKDPAERPVPLTPAVGRIEIREAVFGGVKAPGSEPFVTGEVPVTPPTLAASRSTGPRPPPGAFPAPKASRSIATTIIAVVFATLLVAWVGLAMRGMAGSALDLLGGVALVGGGGLVGYVVRHYLVKRRGELEGETSRILTGAKTRISLTASLAIEVDAIMERCRTLDQRFLGKTLAIMVGEYEDARTFDDRQRALVTAVQFLDKLMDRLSPWYIKYEKLVAALVALVGIVPGVIKIVEAVAG